MPKSKGSRSAFARRSAGTPHNCDIKRVIAIAWIAEMVHPVEVVVHRVIHAVVAVETASPMTGSPTKLRKTVWSEPLPMRVSARLASVTPESSLARFLPSASSVICFPGIVQRLCRTGSCSEWLVSTSMGAREAMALPSKLGPDGRGVDVDVGDGFLP